MERKNSCQPSAELIFSHGELPSYPPGDQATALNDFTPRKINVAQGSRAEHAELVARVGYPARYVAVPPRILDGLPQDQLQ